MLSHTLEPFLLTELLRTSRAAVFAGIRDILERKQFALDATALAAFYFDDRGHHAIVVNRDHGEHELVTPDGIEVTSWHSLPKRARRDYEPVLKRALAHARTPRQPPPGTPIELQLAGRSDVIVLRWTGHVYQRRASFWFADQVFTIDGTVHHGRNDRDDQSSFALVADVPAEVLLDELPAPPIRLDPVLAATGLARLQAITNPPPNGTRFVLHVGSSVSGTIYNSSVRASNVVQVVFDLATWSATYKETSLMDDS
jgi:hypothetical protein